MTRTFWMSFADEDGHRGVCVVDVTEAEVAAMKDEIDAKFPRHKPGAEWLAAAARKAWYYGCNPVNAKASALFYPGLDHIVGDVLLLTHEEYERLDR